MLNHLYMPQKSRKTNLWHVKICAKMQIMEQKENGLIKRILNTSLLWYITVISLFLQEKEKSTESSRKCLTSWKLANLGNAEVTSRSWWRGLKTWRTAKNFLLTNMVQRHSILNTRKMFVTSKWVWSLKAMLQNLLMFNLRQLGFRLIFPLTFLLSSCTNISCSTTIKCNNASYLTQV